MIKLRSKRFFRSSSSVKNNVAAVKNNNRSTSDDIKWELLPSGMLVQRRDSAGDDSSLEGEGSITIRVVSTLSQFHHDIPIHPTSTFGELKVMLSMITNLEPNEQRVLFKGREREDCEYLHMVGVRDKDKVLLFQDPAIKQKNLLAPHHVLPSPYRTITV